MLFQDRQSMQRDLCHTPKISQRFIQSEDLVCGAATRTKSALAILQFWFHNFSAFGIYFSRQTKE